MINSHIDAIRSVKEAFNHMLTECNAVLGSELHYQAMIYHSLRVSGVPANQLGMNVKMWISNPVTPLFQELDKKKNINFQGGFEPIPDVVIFSPLINGDWRRRNRNLTLQHSLVAIEVKASERHKGRLSEREVIYDIKKLSAHRAEAIHQNAGFAPIMLVIDTAPDPAERMKQNSIDRCKAEAEKENIGFIYISCNYQLAMFDNIGWGQQLKNPESENISATVQSLQIPVSTTFPMCVYTIVRTDKLDDIYQGGGSGELSERKNWASANKMLAEAKGKSMTMKVIFAAAEDTQDLIYYGDLKDIKIDKTDPEKIFTTYCLSNLTPFLETKPRKTSLVISSTGNPISEGHIRPYVICDTPKEFLS